MYYAIPQYCLSLLANDTQETSQMDQHPSESHQNVVSPDNTTRGTPDAHYTIPQYCLSLLANDTQETSQMDQHYNESHQNVVSPDDTTRGTTDHPSESHQNVVGIGLFGSFSEIRVSAVSWCAIYAISSGNI